MAKQDIVGLLMIEQSGVATLGGSARSISDLLVHHMQGLLIEQAQKSLKDGGILRFQVFDLGTGDVLFEMIVDCKKPLEEILKFQQI